MATAYKIFRPDEWAAFQRDGRFDGSADDMRDGFIHLSYPDQMLGTLKKYFAGAEPVILASVTPSNPAALKDEVSRGGALFPHYYAPLELSDIGPAIELQPAGSTFNEADLMSALKACEAD